jgi:hypothetical protein
MIGQINAHPVRMTVCSADRHHPGIVIGISGIRSESPQVTSQQPRRSLRQVDLLRRTEPHDGVPHRLFRAGGPAPAIGPLVSTSGPQRETRLPPVVGTIRPGALSDVLALVLAAITSWFLRFYAADSNGRFATCRPSRAPFPGQLLPSLAFGLTLPLGRGGFLWRGLKRCWRMTA